MDKEPEYEIGSQALRDEFFKAWAKTVEDDRRLGLIAKKINKKDKAA